MKNILFKVEEQAAADDLSELNKHPEFSRKEQVVSLYNINWRVSHACFSKFHVPFEFWWLRFYFVGIPNNCIDLFLGFYEDDKMET